MVDLSIGPYMDDEPNLIQEHLFTMKASLYGSPAYLEKFGEPKEIKDLDHHRLITFARGKENPYSEVDWMLKIGREGRKKRKPFYTSNSTANILEAAEQGVGLIIFYDLMERHRKSCLRPVLTDLEGPVFKDYIAYLNREEYIDRIEILKDHLMRRMIKDR